MIQALYRRFRPQTFDQVVGQEHVVRTLRNALASGRVHHAYLFAGPRGTGKTTTARLLAKAVNCLAEDPAQRPCNVCAICQAVNEGRLMDLIEIDAASNTGVDDVRELRERVGFRPSEARYKVYVIDEVHMLSTAAFNALLKTLEEPPPHAIFVLATTEAHKIPATILSRCQRLDFRRIPLATMVERLEQIARQEGLTIEREALTLVARQATGSMRDAESLLDQLAAYNEGGITVAEVRAALGTGDEAAVTTLTDALATRDVAAGLAVISQVVEQGSDPRQFARQVVEHLRALLLTSTGAGETPIHVPEEQRDAFRAQAARFTPQQLTRAIRLFNQAATETRVAWQPQLLLELALMEAVLPADAAAPPASPPPPPPTRPQPAGRGPSTTSAPSSRSTSPSSPPASPAAPPDRPAPPATEPDSPPSSATACTLDEVASRWSALLSEIRSRNLSLEALLRSCRPVAVEENTVLLGFEHAFHKGRVGEENNRRLVEDTLTRLLGRSVQVRCVLSQENSAPVQASPSSASPSEEDPLIQRAMQELGARVVRR